MEDGHPEMQIEVTKRWHLLFSREANTSDSKLLPWGQRMVAVPCTPVGGWITSTFFKVTWNFLYNQHYTIRNHLTPDKGSLYSNTYEYTKIYL